MVIHIRTLRCSAILSKIQVVTDVPALQKRCALPGVSNQNYNFLLTFSAGKLQLVSRTAQFKPFFICFDSETLRYRRAKLSLKNELIAKACHVKADAPPSVLDATAGLGRDAFMLACLGCRVTMLERHPIIAVLLEDALSRARQQPELADIVARLQLVEMDAKQFALGVKSPFDVVYLDPMFPKKKKSALVKKSMQIFQGLAVDDDVDSLFSAVKPCVKSRLVVKRPVKSEPLGQQSPAFVYKGKTNRFDVYLP